MASALLYISEEQVQSVLDWDKLFPAIEKALSDVSSKSTAGDSLVIQPARGLMPIPHKEGVLLTMPGFSERHKTLACKVVTAFVNNPAQHNLPSILANVIVMDADTGRLKAIVAGTTITEWRTACASAVATKHLRPDPGNRKILGVIGAGKQGQIHIIAFQHFFRFREVRLWNRTHERAVKLAEELKDKYGINITVCSTVRDCTKDADVVVTATYSSEPVVKYEDVKPDVMINAIGAGRHHSCELHPNIYEKSAIYTNSMANAKIELKGLEDAGFALEGEVGEVINGSKTRPSSGIVIFHSLGMAVEDIVSASLVFEDFSKANPI